ncbi:uncharacterized protein CTRU02_207094 [Colletotrichum truncatum]|uniref:Uncharacterized protein n=1 Tax=Colletotrichum truncatum TaxID=5467 RepID=A0ACC3YZV6_COLTU|nr:uncharacterized protein CTRU02_01282 [Colletotrichum truncatum]KAF6800877.1 hypothetical protein CTRU02_01282 [Colletotrichum truncatum]
MSVPSEDVIRFAQELDMTKASYPSSRPASMERQTKLAHLKLVSKYYGCANFSYPRPDGTSTRNPYRRAGQAYSTEDLNQDYNPDLLCPETPTRRDRTSIGSQSSDGSTPSLIDDRTDSEVSLDDDYQYHASASQLWDTFWQAEEGPSQKTPEKSKTQYPALIPSPHIRRAKKAGRINYEDYPLPPRPVEYNIKVNHPAPPPKDDSLTQMQPQPATKEAQAPLEPRDFVVSEESRHPFPGPRRTVRAVRSSYCLFPRTQSPVPSYPPPPPPRLPTLPKTKSLRRGPRPPPIHLYSLPVPAAAPLPSPATASLYTPLYSPPFSPVPSLHTRPHTSQGSYISSVIDLVQPRSAPLPSEIPESDTPRGPEMPKSFFDFDSDSESDDSEPEHAISRLVKNLHMRNASDTRRGAAKASAAADSQLRRARGDAEPEREADSQMLFDKHKRSAARFGRMFGRAGGKPFNL